jgi:hypothetical protein
MAAFTLAGCGAKLQLPIQINQNVLTNQQNKIGVIMTAVPAPETHIYGAGCLLCYGVASGLTSKLDKHLKTLATDDIASLKKEVFDALKLKGLQPILIDAPLDLDKLKKFKGKGENLAKYDFSKYKSNDIDMLLVIEVTEVGGYRTFSSYIPTSDPQGYVNATSYLVDLNTNTYLWYNPAKTYVSVEMEWDEPPTFPGMTKAFYQAIQESKQKVLNPIQ